MISWSQVEGMEANPWIQLDSLSFTDIFILSLTFHADCGGLSNQSIWLEDAAWSLALGALGVPPADHVIMWNFSLWHSTCCVLALVISWTQLLNLCVAHNLHYIKVTRRFNLICVWWFERQTVRQRERKREREREREVLVDRNSKRQPQ